MATQSVERQETASSMEEVSDSSCDEPDGLGRIGGVSPPPQMPEYDTSDILH